MAGRRAAALLLAERIQSSSPDTMLHLPTVAQMQRLGAPRDIVWLCLAIAAMQLPAQAWSPTQLHGSLRRNVSL